MGELLQSQSLSESSIVVLINADDCFSCKFYTGNAIRDQIKNKNTVLILFQSISKEAQSEFLKQMNLNENYLDNIRIVADSYIQDQLYNALIREKMLTFKKTVVLRKTNHGPTVN